MRTSRLRTEPQFPDGGNGDVMSWLSRWRATAYAPTFLAGKKALLQSCIFSARRTPVREQTPFQCIGLPCWRSYSLNDGLYRGKEQRCSRRLLRKSKLQHLRVACVRAASSTFWTIWGLGGTRGCRHPARGSTHRPRCRFSLGRAALEDAGGRPRRRADWGRAPGAAVDGASRWGRMCWIASVCCCTAENCWAKPSTVLPNSPAWEMGAMRKRALSTFFISARLSQRWRSWTTMVDIAFPRDHAVTFVARRAKSVAVHSSRRRGRFLQVAAFHVHRCTAIALSTWGMPAYTLAAPPVRVVRMEEADEQLLAVKGAIHDFVSSSCTSGTKGTGAGRGCEPRPAPRNQSSSREGSGLGGLLTSSPMLTAVRASMAVSSGSGRCVRGKRSVGAYPVERLLL